MAGKRTRKVNKSWEQVALAVNDRHGTRLTPQGVRLIGLRAMLKIRAALAETTPDLPDGTHLSRAYADCMTSGRSR
jgi:hypothetical protein